MPFLGFGVFFLRLVPKTTLKEACGGARPSPGARSTGKTPRAQGPRATTPCLWPICPPKARRRSLWAAWSAQAALPSSSTPPWSNRRLDLLGLAIFTLYRGDFKLHQVFQRAQRAKRAVAGSWVCLFVQPGECLVPQFPPEPMPSSVPKDAGLLRGHWRAGDAAGATQVIWSKAKTHLNEASF